MKTVTTRSCAYILSLAGWLLFASLLILVLLVGKSSMWPGILINYGYVILSFLGGVQWGIAITANSASNRLVNIILSLSVLPALAAWLLLSSHFTIRTQLNVIILLFILTLLIDIFLAINKLIKPWFLTLRCIISLLVVVTLFIANYVV
jgi:hypothetical protein